MLLTAGTALLLFGTIAEAQAGGRGGTVIGPRGGSMSWHRGCDSGTCSRSRSVTGPAGRTYTREGSITRTGPGSWERDVTARGPYGGTYERHGYGTCAGGACTYGGTVTGPRGNTGVYSGRWYAY